MLRFLARLIAVLCAVAFVFAAVGAIFVYSVGTRFLRPQTYAQALGREHFYGRGPGIVAGLGDRPGGFARVSRRAAAAVKVHMQ